MPNEYVISGIVFLSVAAAVFMAYLVLAQRRRMAAQRRRAALESGDSSPDLVLGSLTPALAAQVPIMAGDRSDLERELRQAGYYRPNAVVEYAAVRSVLVVAPIVAAGALALLTDAAQDAMWFWVGGIVLAMLGYSLPRIVIYYQGQTRMHAIERALPTAIDMLTLCLGAGLNVLVALRRVTREMQPAHPILASEFETVLRQADLKSLDFALGQFANRVAMPHVRNLAVLVGQSESLGTDVVRYLREYADSMRVNMRQRAEEMANKAPMKLMIPAYMLALGAGILLISPAVFEFSRLRQNALVGTLKTESKQSLSTPTTRPTPTAGAEGNP